jgi:hypothetical protein
MAGLVPGGAKGCPSAAADGLCKTWRIAKAVGFRRIMRHSGAERGLRGEIEACQGLIPIDTTMRPT